MSLRSQLALYAYTSPTTSAYPLVVLAGLAAGDTPSVSITCPVCGTIESFNTRLSAEDEDATAAGNSASRADQARLVRALCRLAGLVVLG